MLEHVQCEQCGGYVLRGAATCPARGKLLPGRGLLRRRMGLLLVASVVAAAITLVSWLWWPVVKSFGDIAAHDAKIESPFRKDVEPTATHKKAQEERPGPELDRTHPRGK